MDTYEENLEENEVISQPDPAENQTVECPEEPAETEQIPAAEESDAAQEDAPQIPTEGYYHGVGTGTRENPYFIDGYTAAPQATAAPEKPKRPRKKGVFKKILKCTAASILIVALVASACGISIVATNAHWKHYNQILQQYLVAVRCTDMVRIFDDLDQFMNALEPAKADTETAEAAPAPEAKQ